MLSGAFEHEVEIEAARHPGVADVYGAIRSDQVVGERSQAAAMSGFFLMREASSAKAVSAT